MGAEYFETTWAGRDATEAFRFCTEEARHLEGHGGYTGTIAEKSSFVLYELPARMTFPKMMKLVRLYEERQWALDEAERMLGAKAAERKRAQARLRKAERAFDKACPDRPLRDLVRRVYNTTEDKWGPAAAFERTGKVAKEFKARNGLKGTRKRVYTFCGHASS